MVHLILLTAPIGTALAGIAISRIFAWCIHQLWNDGICKADESAPMTTPADDGHESKKEGKKKKVPKKPIQKPMGSSFDEFIALKNGFETASKLSEGIIVKQIMAYITLFLFYLVGKSFSAYCFRLANNLSNLRIILKATCDGHEVVLDDYCEAYFWLHDSMPEDARITAWWDYGYQIMAIANRTTIADGNTWNHEHIALLGRALTSPEEEGHRIAHHLADCVSLGRRW